MSPPPPQGKPCPRDTQETPKMKTNIDLTLTYIKEQCHVFGVALHNMPVHRLTSYAGRDEVGRLQNI